jgi:hypothetical protein
MVDCVKLASMVSCAASHIRLKRTQETPSSLLLQQSPIDGWIHRDNVQCKKMQTGRNKQCWAGRCPRCRSDDEGCAPAPSAHAAAARLSSLPPSLTWLSPRTQVRLSEVDTNIPTCDPEHQNINTCPCLSLRLRAMSEFTIRASGADKAALRHLVARFPLTFRPDPSREETANAPDLKQEGDSWLMGQMEAEEAKPGARGWAPAAAASRCRCQVLQEPAASSA